MGHSSSKDNTDEKPKKDSRDIRLLVPDEMNNLHTVVVPHALLVERSSVFRDLIASGSKKKRKKLKLQDVTVIGVLKIMQYVEDGNVIFENVNEVSETLKVAEKYGIEGIDEVCFEYLSDSLSTNNVCEVFEFAIANSRTDLIYKCLKIIDREAELVLKSEGFTKLKQSSVIDILKRNSLHVASETSVFKAALQWGETEVVKRGANPEDKFNSKYVLRPILNFVRFQNMTPEELSDFTICEFLASLSLTQNKDMKFGLMSKANQASAEKESFVESCLNSPVQPRHYTDHHIHSLEVFESAQHSISNGETFLLSLEMLKGKSFLCGVKLAIRVFSTRMTASCLYAALLATNTRTAEQRRARGTFVDAAGDSSMIFPSPLFLEENDKVEVALNVKMAGNVCPMTRKNDVEIIVPETKEIAIKVLGNNSTSINYRCIFQDIIYFF